MNWVVGPGNYAVRIDVAGGPVTAPNFIETQLKESDLGALGVVFDADDMTGSGEDRWAQVKGRCHTTGIELPNEPPPAGVTVTLPGGVRFGVWMMPDNRPPGMLETFLLGLLSAEETAGNFSNTPGYPWTGRRNSARRTRRSTGTRRWFTRGFPGRTSPARNSTRRSNFGFSIPTPRTQMGSRHGFAAYLRFNRAPLKQWAYSG